MQINWQLKKKESVQRVLEKTIILNEKVRIQKIYYGKKVPHNEILGDILATNRKCSERGK